MALVKRHPALLLALAAVVAALWIEPAGIALPGLAVGALGGLAALQAGLLLGAVLTGVRVHRVVIGIGPRLHEWRSPRHTTVLRAVPLALSVAVGPGRTPVRVRMWLAALVSALTLAALTTLAALHPGPGEATAVAGAAVLVHALLPRSDAGSTSTGWLLLRLPRLPAREVAELAAAPLVDRAMALVDAGEPARAQAVADELTAAHPELRATRAVQATVHEAHGRYGDALAAAIALVADPEQTERDLALALAGLAGLAAAAVEAGELDPATGLETARRAATDAEALHFPASKLAGTRGLIALLDGDPAQAVMLAGAAAGSTDHGLSRADDLATLARAHMAAGDNRSARAALAEAEDLAAWWPRVAATRERLAVR